MKAVLISIQPKWCELIASGKKTVEVRKTKPKLETPFKVYIYCTAGRELSYADICGYDMTDYRKDYLANRKVIGEFVCDRVYQYASDMFRSAPVEGTDISTKEMTKLSCLTAKELYEYEHSTEPKENCICLVGVYGWHIFDLKVYGKPKLLSEFFRGCPEWEKEEITPKCRNCEHHFRNYEECYEGCAREGELPIARPPQSWCYVEDGK